MARTSRQSSSSLIDLLFREANRFDFFQAVRILYRAARRGLSHTRHRQPIGDDNHPNEELVRFRSSVSLSFPATAIQQLKNPDTAEQSEEPGSCPPEMTVNFMGLVGPCGVLPQHYTERLIRKKNRSLNDFFDIFNHRSISLFYKAWMKYRLPAAYEHVEEPSSDPISAMLVSLVGFGTAGLSGRLAFAENVLRFYAGHFSRAIRPMSVLEDVLSEYFNICVKIEPFRGRWIDLTIDQRSELASSERPNGQYAQLGINTIIGDQIWDSGGAFRVCIGPVCYSQFVAFMPNSSSRKLIELTHLIRIFVGPEFEFDIQVILDGAEVPACRLSGDENYEPRLGWNTWLVRKPLDEHRSDAVFVADDF